MNEEELCVVCVLDCVWFKLIVNGIVVVSLVRRVIEFIYHMVMIPQINK